MILGFIGTGKISSSIIYGIFKSKLKIKRIYISSRNKNIAKKLQKQFRQVKIIRDNQEIINKSSTIVLGLAPFVGNRILPKLKFSKNKKIISLISTINLEKLKKITKNKNIVRATPLPPVEIKKGPIVICPPNKNAKNFLNDLTSVNGGEYLNEPMNQSLAYAQIKNYEDISKKRFSNIDKTVYASGYRSFFDITPDLRFILGKDTKFKNLFHNLGSGQAMKYCPILGECIAEEIMNEKFYTSTFEYSKFNISRFSDDYMKEFWNLVQGEENTLHRQGKNTL